MDYSVDGSFREPECDRGQVVREANCRFPWPQSIDLQHVIYIEEKVEPFERVAERIGVLPELRNTVNVSVRLSRLLIWTP